MATKNRRRAPSRKQPPPSAPKLLGRARAALAAIPRWRPHVGYDSLMNYVPFLALAILIASVSYFFAWGGEPGEYWFWHNVLHLL